MSEYDNALNNAIPESLMLSANARAKRGQQDAAERAAAEEEKKTNVEDRKAQAGRNLLAEALSGLFSSLYSGKGREAISGTADWQVSRFDENQKKAAENAKRNEEMQEAKAAAWNSMKPEKNPYYTTDPAIVDTGYGPYDMANSDDLLAMVSSNINRGNRSYLQKEIGVPKSIEDKQSDVSNAIDRANHPLSMGIDGNTAEETAPKDNLGTENGNKSGTNAGIKSGSKDNELTPEESREANDNMFDNDEVTTTDNLWQPKEAQSDLAVAWYDSLGGDDEAMSNHLASSSLVYDEYRQLASTMPGYADSGFGQYDNLLDFQMYGSADEWLEWTKFANETQGYYRDLEGVDGYIDPDKFYEFYDMCKREYEISQILGQNGALSPEETNMYSYLLLTDYQTCQAAAQYLVDAAAANGLDISSYLQDNGVADQDTLARLLYLNSNSYGAVDKGADSYNEAYRLMAEEDAAAGLNPRRVEVGAYRPYAEGGVYTGNRRTPKALWSADTATRGGIGKAINEKGSELWNELNLDPDTGDKISVADRNYIDKLLAANQYQLGYGSRYV